MRSFIISQCVYNVKSCWYKKKKLMNLYALWIKADGINFHSRRFGMKL